MFIYSLHLAYHPCLPCCAPERKPAAHRAATSCFGQGMSYVEGVEVARGDGMPFLERYAAGAANELLWALEGLIEEG